MGLAGADSGGSAGERNLPDGDCVVHVSQASGSDDSDGTTWDRAVASVTRGLALADPGCELWITSGTYLPGTSRNATFHVEGNVTVRGSFDGTETTPEERTNGGPATVLSGELGSQSSVGDNALHVVTTSDSTFDRIDVTGGNADDGSDGGGGILASGGLVLKECSIYDNRAGGSGGGVLAHDQITIDASNFSNNVAGDFGGAVAALGAGPLTISRAVFYAGSAHSGGAVHTNAASVSVADSVFGRNVADELGGGIDAIAGSTLTVSSCAFYSNEALDGSAIATFGTLTLNWSSLTNNSCGQPNGIVSAHATSNVTGCDFSGNAGSALLARGDSGPCDMTVSLSTFTGNHASMGAGIHSEGCTLLVSACSFADNAADGNGGGIAVQTSGLTLSDSTFQTNTGEAGDGGGLFADLSTVSLTNDDFVANNAQSGGALTLYQGSSGVVSNSRLVGNTSESGGGAILVWESTLELENSEVAGNTTAVSGVLYSYAPGGAGMTLTNVTMTGNVAQTGAAIHATGALTLVNSILWGDSPAEVLLEADSTLALTSSNLTGTYPYLTAVDPHFVDPVYDLALESDSPCIDTADDAYAPSTDRLGNARLDLPYVPTCPVETPSCGSLADMGAYEYRY